MRQRSWCMLFCIRLVNRCVLITTVSASTLTPLFSQSAPTDERFSALATLEADVSKRLAEARSFIEKGQDEAADARIARDASSKPQSADWHQEKAADLLRIAFSAQESGNTKTAQRAARLVLAQLDKAEALSKDNNEVLANISELRGVIRERLLGNTEEAVNEYKKALSLNPDSPSSRQKLRQLNSLKSS